MSDTDTSSETDEKRFPEQLKSLFNLENIKFPEDKSKAESELWYQKYKKHIPKTTAIPYMKKKKKKKKEQSLNPIWMYHRPGRITASIAGEVYKTNVDIISQSLLNKIMQYSEFMKKRNTRFGTNTEPLDWEYYKNAQLNYKNLIVKQYGFLIKETYPHLGVSSDGILSCTYHNDRVLEIKCPHNSQNELKDWQNDKKFPVNPDGSFK